MIRNVIENRNYNYELILRKPNKEPVSFVVYENLSFTKNFNSPNSLSFTVPKYLYNQKTKTTYTNPVWEKIKGGWIIELQAWDSDYVPQDTYIGNTTYPRKCVYNEYFAVEQPDLSASSDKNDKDINCVSLYQSIFNKFKLRGFDDTRKLFDCRFDANMQPILDGNGYPIPIAYSTSDFTKGGIINYILEKILPNWKVGYYDADLLNVGKPTIEPTYSADFFNGTVTYATDDENVTYIKTGLRTYWTSGDGLTLWNNVFIPSGTTPIVLEYLDGTEKEAEQYISILNNLMGKVDIATMLSVDNVNAVLTEPLLGNQMLGQAQEMLVEMRNYLQTLYSYKFCGQEDGDLFPDAIQDYVDDVNNLCNAIFNNLYTSLFYQYGTATGKFPYRSLKFEANNLMDVFQSLSESFLCIFEFDSIKNLINIYSRDNEAVDSMQTLIISPENYMTSIQYQAKTDQVVTRLYVAGKDNLWFTDYNITGQRYVDDFSYFAQNSDSGMSQDLIAALERYDALKAAHQNDTVAVTMWYCDNDTYHSGTSNMSIPLLVNKIAQLDTEISEAQRLARTIWLTKGDSSINRELDSGVTPETSITAAQRDAVELAAAELNSQFTQIVDFSLIPDALQANLRRVWDIENDVPNENYATPDTHSTFYMFVNYINCKTALTEWQEQFLYENAEDSGGLIFSSELLSELNNFIYEDDITFGNISDGQILYNYAKEYLKYINTIPVTINIGLVDILNNYIYQMDWSKITDVGAKIYVEFKDFNLTLNNSIFKIMSYTHNISPNSQDLSIVLSNTYAIENDYNKMVIDIWGDSYKQIQDINSYRKTWNDFINKQNEMMLQGQTIQSDINSIVNNTGNTIIGAKGLSLGKSKGNALRLNADGYYSRDKAYTSDVSGSGYSANEKLYPDVIEFSGAQMTYSQQTDGTRKLAISATGGGGGGVEGLPRYYTAPFCSQKLQALDVRNGSAYITTNANNAKCIYYAEIVMQGTNGGELRYYQATLTVDAEDPSGYVTEQFTDNASRNMYYAVKNGVVDYNTLVYENTGYPVKIYSASLTTTFQVKRNGNHVPQFIFGVGIGDNTNKGKWLFIKENDIGKFVYVDTVDGLEYGISIKEDENTNKTATYIRYKSTDYEAVPYRVYDSYAQADADKNNMPEGSIGFY